MSPSPPAPSPRVGSGKTEAHASQVATLRTCKSASRVFCCCFFSARRRPREYDDPRQLLVVARREARRRVGAVQRVAEAIPQECKRPDVKHVMILCLLFSLFLGLPSSVVVVVVVAECLHGRFRCPHGKTDANDDERNPQHSLSPW